MAAEQQRMRPIARMCRIAVMAAALCVAAPWAVPVGPVPISFATLAVYLIGAVLGWVDGTIAVAVYLLLGAVGVPVFSGFSGGVQKLVGATGGYLLGYLPCAAIVGCVADRTAKPLWQAAAMALGTVLLYALGTAWFVFQSGRTVGESLTLCVLPFLAGDAAKITVAALLSLPLRRASDRLTHRSPPKDAPKEV